MSIDTGGEKIDEKQRPRRGAVPLIPRAKIEQTKERSICSPSQESIGPGSSMEEKNVSRTPREKAGEARGAPMLLVWLGHLRYYGSALLFVGGAAVLRWALSDVLSPAPFLVFYLGLVGAAAFGGLGPGLLATLTSWLCIDFLFDPTSGLIGFDDSASIARLLVFLSGGLIISGVGEAMRRSRLRERRQGRELADANGALRESEFHLAQAQQITHLGSWSWDIVAGRLFWSDEIYRLYGLQPGESQPRHEDFLGFIHPEDRSQVEQGVQEALAHGGPYRLDFRIIPKGGQERYVHCEARVTLDREGHPVKAEGALQDITERKQAEEALVESRKKYRGLVERINDWVWEIDADGVYTYVSPRSLELLGYAPEEIVGKTPFDLMPPAEAQQVWNAFESTWLARKSLEQLENTLVRKDGRLVTVETSGMPVFAEDGTFVGYMGIDRDVTARKEAEKALRASQESLALAQKIAHLGNWSWDIKTNEQEWSDESSRIFGYEPGECRPDHDLYVELLHPEDRERLFACWKEALERNVPFSIDYRIIRRDGSVRYVHSEGQIVRNDQDQPVRVFGTNQDITERKQAEAALRKSEADLAKAQAIAHLAGWEFDVRTYKLRGSQELHRLFNLEPESFTEATFLERIHPDDRCRVSESIYAAIRAGTPYNTDYRIVPHPGEVRHVHAEGEVARDDNGLATTFFGIVQDITERKQAEQELRELNATLESRVARRTAHLQYRAGQLQKLTLELTKAEERERKRLAEILHDDLQQVLVAAKFQVGLLSSRVKNDTESHEIAEQTKDLLGDAIAKSRSLSHELSAPGLSRSNLLEAFEWLTEQMLQRHRFTVHLEMGEQIAVASEPLRVLLYKAAQELLFNSIKHAGVHEAKLRLRHRRGRLRLLVSDAGRGFDPTEPGRTLGFGLLSIRERVEYLGGRLKIRSAVGKGSIFVITVPVDATA